MNPRLLVFQETNGSISSEFLGLSALGLNNTCVLHCLSFGKEFKHCEINLLFSKSHRCALLLIIL